MCSRNPSMKRNTEPIFPLETLLWYKQEFLWCSFRYTLATLVLNCLLEGTSPGNRRRQWQAPPVLLPGKSHGRRSLVGCSPRGHYELDTTERLHFHSSLSRIGEGNGNPLQCSCLENPRDGGAWWAAVSGVAQRQD